MNTLGATCDKYATMCVCGIDLKSDAKTLNCSTCSTPICCEYERLLVATGTPCAVRLPIGHGVLVCARCDLDLTAQARARGDLKKHGKLYAEILMQRATAALKYQQTLAAAAAFDTATAIAYTPGEWFRL